LEVAISGGRHSVSGASSSEGGLVIDLRQMRKVTVHTPTDCVVAQGGCTWEDVDTELAKYDLATGACLLSSFTDISRRNRQRYWNWWTYPWRGIWILEWAIWV